MPELPAALAAVIDKIPRLGIAFSGGLDSRFLAHAAHLRNRPVHLVHVRGPHVPAGESEAAIAWARQGGLAVTVAEFDPLTNAGARANSRDRCYHCKKGMLAAMRAALGAGWQLCDGSHADDERAFRPGARALVEAGIVSPLALARLDKAAIRAAARATGLENPQQKARPCLLTRFAYGLTPTAAQLAHLEQAEAALAEILGPDADFRLRLTPAPILQATADPGKRWPALQALLAAHGFAQAKLLVGKRISGFFDAQMPAPSAR